MIIKQVKEYSKRKRIEINKNDNVPAGAKVIILSENEYTELKNKLNDYDALLKENQILQKQENNLKEIIKDVTAPIYENHQKELETKDNEIKQLKQQVNAIRKSISHYIMELSSLNILNFIFKKKHKKIIRDMNSAVFQDADDDVPAIADTKKLE